MLEWILAGLITVLPVSTFDRYGTERPPASYAHYPTRPVLRIEVPLDQVTQVCDPHAVPPSPVYFGCTEFSEDLVRAARTNRYLTETERRKIRREYARHKDLCVIIIPQLGPKVDFGWQWSIWTHEFAHCNGALHHKDARGWFRLLDGSPIER